MTALFAFIFVSSLILGFGYGWLNHLSGLQMAIPIIIGGFFGSCLIAIVFTYLYFTGEETDREKIKRLKDEIVRLKKENSIK